MCICCFIEWSATNTALLDKILHNNHVYLGTVEDLIGDPKTFTSVQAAITFYSSSAQSICLTRANTLFPGEYTLDGGQVLSDWNTPTPVAQSVPFDNTATSYTGETVQEVLEEIESQLGGGTPDWADITNKPTTFAPSAHTHPQADITNLTTDLAGKAALSHTHAQADITNLVTDLAAKVPTTRTVNGLALSSNITLAKGDIGLGNVDNTSDANKPVSTATQTALDGKVDENAAITGATKTKVTYDAKGLVTGGADATTADIADSTNKRYVTDAQLTVIGNTSGTNTGDQTSIVGITGTLAEFNTALTGADFATGGGTVTGTSSGTNTGDQTSIVGITGTKAQFDTAVTDGNFLYVGDVTQYTDEMAQDAVGGIVDSSLVYNDATPSLSRAALTGDVTASAGSNATTIADGAVTLAKQANLATQRIIARNTAGTGVPESVTITQILDWIGSTQGQILYRNGTAWTVLAPGIAGQVLQSGGAGANPSWTTASGGGLTANQSRKITNFAQ
jgi:hypothetical protein